MASYPAFLNSALTVPSSVDGTWLSSAEVVIGASRSSKLRFWVLNNTGRQQMFTLDRQTLKHFSLSAPETILLSPGRNYIEFPIEATAPEAPIAEDFVLRYYKPMTAEYGSLAYSGINYASWDAWATGAFGEAEDEFRVEVTAFFLEAGDPRFPNLIPSALYSPETYAKHIASGAGYVTPAFRDGEARALGEIMYPLALWAVNKHAMFDPLVSPMRFVDKRSSAINYAPPGLMLYPPPIRRTILSQAYALANMIGSKQGVIRAFLLLGVNIKEVVVTHDLDRHTWVIEVPRYIFTQFNQDFLGQFALYHVDAYEQVEIKQLGSDRVRLYTDIDFTHVAFTS